jgi:hypothetical protein
MQPLFPVRASNMEVLAGTERDDARNRVCSQNDETTRGNQVQSAPTSRSDLCVCEFVDVRHIDWSKLAVLKGDPAVRKSCTRDEFGDIVRGVVGNCFAVVYIAYVQFKLGYG